MTTLLAILALGALVVNVSPAVADQATDCETYWWNLEKFETCRGGVNRYVYGVDYVYKIANKTCRDRNKTVTCMKEAVKYCGNSLDLARYTQVSFGFCDENGVSSVMTNFFENNLGKSLNLSCLLPVIHEIRDNYKRPLQVENKGDVDLEAQISTRKSYYTWYIKYFLTKDQNEAVESCGGMTRRTIYGIMIATLGVTYGWGMDFYPEFVSVVQPTATPWIV